MLCAVCMTPGNVTIVVAVDVRESIDLGIAFTVPSPPIIHWRSQVFLIGPRHHEPTTHPWSWLGGPLGGPSQALLWNPLYRTKPQEGASAAVIGGKLHGLVELRGRSKGQWPFDGPGFFRVIPIGRPPIGSFNQPKPQDV